jgi:TM2 domain-containing membrane protein YozV
MRWWSGSDWTENLQPPQPPQAYAPAKNPGIAVLLSFFLPGAGNLYAGSTTAGAVLLISWFVSWFLLLAGIPAVLIVWVVGMVTAHSAAVKFNLRNGIRVR